MEPRQRIRSGSGRAEDDALIARVADDDIAAIQALYMAHSGAIAPYVRSRVRDGAEAAGIVHDTMILVW